MHLTHIRLLVTTFAECFRFYRDALGFKVRWGEEDGGYADFLAGNGAILALFDRRAMAEAVGTADLPQEATSQDRVALIIAADNLEASVARLREYGATIVTDPQDRPDWGIRTAHLRDPDGNLIELYVPLPEQT